MSRQPNVLKVSFVILLLLGFGAYVVYSLNSEEFHAMRESARQARESSRQLKESLDALERSQAKLEEKSRTPEISDQAEPTYWSTPQSALDKLAEIKASGELPNPVQSEWPKADLTPRPHLELLSSKGTTNEYSTTVTGKIKNNTSQTYTYVQVLFDVYDSSGHRVGSAMGNINNLGPQETWRFNAVYIGEDGHRFRLDEITGF